MMKIVFDCFKLVKGKGKSIGIYNVAHSMLCSMVNEQKNIQDKRVNKAKIIVLGNVYNEEDFNIEGVTFVKIDKYNPLNKVHVLLWELELVSVVCEKLKADIVVFPRGYSAFRHPVKDIVLIHDLIPYYYDEMYPGYMNPIENTYIKIRLKQSAKSSKGIITISQASANDLKNRFGISNEKIRVVGNTYNILPYFKTEKKQSEKKYIIAITSGLPHKNSEGIGKSYIEYCKISEMPLDLVVIGVGNSFKESIPNIYRDKVKCYEYVEKDEDLWQLFANAEIMLFLSKLEGFGLPPLEAMQFGTPVVCSNRMSLPEVVGDAAILVDPDNVENVAKQLYRLEKDVNLRSELSKRGKENIKRFSGESRGRAYWAAINELT